MNKLNLTLNEKSTKVTRQIKIIIHYRTYLGVNICLREKQKCKKKGKEREIYVIILLTPNMLLPRMRVFGVLTLCRIIVFLTFRRKVPSPSSQAFIRLSRC